MVRGHTNEVDVNATINILRAEHARLACQARGGGMPPAIGTTENGGVAAAFGIFTLQGGDDVKWYEVMF